MSHIQMFLLQTPIITIDDTPVTLPFKKAEGLLYYLAVNKMVSREQAASLFWSSNDEPTAKKNLRHALYTIKKTFGEEVILSPQKQVLSLNPELSLSTDYDDFLKNDRIELYRGEFLQGFYVKNAEEFEDWLTMERNTLKDFYLRKLFERMSQLDDTQVSEAEACFKSYIREDPIDERAYFLMMQIYQKNHLYHKGIKVYEKLSKLLNAELRISPGKEIAALYRSLLNAWTEETAEEAENAPVAIKGREKEVRALTQFYHGFLSGSPTAVFLSGENGVGKSHLLNHFLDDLEGDNCLVLRSICFYQEKNLPFHPWNAIIMQIDRYIQQHHLKIPQRYLSTLSSLFPMFGTSELLTHVPEDVDVFYNHRAAHNSVLKLFTLIGTEIPIILAFDNIQFMDTLSLELLSSMIRDQNPNILILGTHLDILNATMQKFISSLSKERMIHELEVTPFSRETVREFVEERFGTNALNDKLLEQIYNETEGNAFFLENVLNQFTGASLSNISMVQSQNILSDRILSLSEASRQILDIISLFHDYVTLDTIESITNRDTLEILSLLDELKEQALIRETIKDNEIRFRFRHNKMQEFVHSQLSHTKRRLLHHRAAEYLLQEKGLRTNYWYERIIYHYTLCGDEPNTLKYRILELEEFSSYNFELYPILNSLVDTPSQDSCKMAAAFEELKMQLYQLCHRYPTAIDYSESEARLLYLAGKYYIAQGYYEEGVPAIRQVLSRNDYAREHPDFYIQCLRQLTFYGIQIWDTELMEQSISQCMDLEQTHGLEIDLAIENRLYGLLLSMKGSYTDAEIYLKKSIDSFRQSPLKAQSFALNIAACRNYLGDLYRKQQNFSQAIAYYQEAIETCKKRGCPVSPTFYTNLSRAYLAAGQHDEGVNMLKKACQLYDDCPTLMGRSIAKGYLSCAEARLGNMEKASALLLEAMESAPRLSSPLELGLLALAKAKFISSQTDKPDFLANASLPELCREAAKYLSALPGCDHELTVLNKLLQASPLSFRQSIEALS